MALKVYELTCNYMVNPIGLDELPYFSFKIDSENKEEKLSAYQIVVCDESHVVWDSKKVNKDQQLWIPFEGEELQPEKRYRWKVCVWNQADECFESEEAFFEMGRMKPYHWEAKWITSEPTNINIAANMNRSTSPYMRREFDITKPVKDATLYISGLGYYECYINGQSVKDSVLDPAFTEYDKAVMYCTHKITNLKQGTNAIGIVLGDGFYNTNAVDVWNYATVGWRDHSKCMCVLNICYEDGTKDQIVSDKSFKGTKGPIVDNDVRALEKYDANLELGDWTMPGYDDSTWNTVTVTRGPGGEMSGQYTTPIRIVKTYAPQKIEKRSKDLWFVDVGFNTSGWAKITMTAPKGTEVVLRYGEGFDEEYQHLRRLSQFLKEINSDKFQKNIYIAKGEGVETWHPIFQYHGFRYIVVTCETGIPEDLQIEIQEVRTDLKKIGNFECSDEMTNKIYEIACRATETNFHGMPTDCPHREKNGWTADAHLSTEQLLFNYDAGAAYSRWMDDVVRAQRKNGQLPGIIPSTGWGFNWGSGPVWDSVCAIIPYMMYLYCGDTSVLRKIYPCIKQYLKYAETMSTDDICHFGLQDWCPPIDDWHKQCEGEVTDTAYIYYDTLIAAKIATLLGYEEDAKEHTKNAKRIRASFRKRFIKRADTELELNCTKCQTALGCMLYFGLVEDDEREIFVKELVNEIALRGDHLDVGVPGIKLVCNALLENGQADLMMKVITTPTYPSVGYIVTQGATTLWETWHGAESQNHHMHSDVVACFYKALAGINVDEEHPAFKHTIFRPYFVEGINDVKAEHETPYGKVASSWKREDKKVLLTITVPLNCTGTLYVPNGWRVENSELCELNVTAGEHTFIFVE